MRKTADLDKIPLEIWKTRKFKRIFVNRIQA